MLEKLKGLKPWQKAAVGIITIGVTGTVIIISVNAYKKKLKKKQDQKAVLDTEAKAQAIAVIIRNIYGNAVDRVGGVTAQENITIQGHLKTLGGLGYMYNNGKAERK